jgi:hypothetical protein
MKIIRLTHLIAMPATAMPFRNPRKNPSPLYFNIKHGSKGKSFWMHTTSINVRVAQPTTETDVLELKGDHYIIRPSYKDGLPIKDAYKNTIYNISSDNLETHKNDILCYWEIPNKNYIEVTTEITGEIAELGRGYTGKDRNDRTYKSPAPVLEITGSGRLYWEAIDDKGDKYSQEIFVYTDKPTNFDIKPIIKHEKE